VRLGANPMRFLRRAGIGPDTYRTVAFDAGAPQANNLFCNNVVCSALYFRGWLTPIIFLAKGVLFEEFTKGPNFYFLCIGALQAWSETTYTAGIPTTAPALSAVVIFSCVLKLHQDFGRYRSDLTMNSSRCMRLEGGAFVRATWSDVRVGDFLKVQNLETLPADVMLVCTHEPDPAQPAGACHVETKSLDGETALKGRSVASVFTRSCGGTLNEQTQVITSSIMRGKVTCEQPNAGTNKFTGRVNVEGQQPCALSISNVLLRGSSVRNTEYVIGMVLNTGVETKVMQGAREPRSAQGFARKKTPRSCLR